MIDEVKFDHISIIGLGLLGGSIAKTARKLGIVKKVTGCGRNDSRLEYAVNNGIADKVTKNPVDAVKGADLVFICTPVGTIPGIIENISGYLNPGCIVSDVGSTKQEIVEKAESCLPRNVNFIGCHPMAGSEESGIEAATDCLFENAICVLTSSEKTNITALNKLSNLWETFKSRVMILTPEEHDHLVAASSHLPHMVAVSLVNCISDIAEENDKVLPLLAGGFRDTTRIASGSSEMWMDICRENKDYIIPLIDKYISSLKEISCVISENSDDKLLKRFVIAKEFRDELPEKGKGVLDSDNEIIVDVADRPGVIGEITCALGKEGINIRNINVRHVRELSGGTLSLIIEKSEDMEKAVSILEGSGLKAKIRN
mgnify:CR=1 FL=1